MHIHNRSAPFGASGLTVALLLLGGSHSAYAQGWNGPQGGTYSGNNFLISGSTISGYTITVTPGSGKLTVPNAFTGSETLMGIRGIWIVDTSGNAISTVTATTNSLTSSVSGTPASSWTPGSSPAGFSGSSGFGSGKNWIMLAPFGTVSQEHGATSPYTGGKFTFSSLPTSGYDIGIDYLTDSGSQPGNTGRAYFHYTPPSSTPEPSTVAPFALIGLGLLCLTVRAKKRQQDSLSLP